MTPPPRRILIVAPRVWDGGMELHVSNLALLYSAHGHDVTLAVHPRFPDDLDRRRRLAASTVNIVRVPEYGSAPLPLRVWKRRTRLRNALPEGSFDYLICHGFGRSLDWYRRFLAPGGRFFWHEHTDGANARVEAPDFQPPVPGRYPWLFRRMFRHVDAVLTGCDRGAANLRQIQGLRRPIRVLPPLMETGEIPGAMDREIGGHPLRIAVFGTLHPAKGTDALLRLWPSLSIGPAELHFHGAFAMPPLDELVSGLGVPAAFHGPYCSADLAALMDAADMAIVPSLQEGYSIAAWECMAWGVPFVMTDVGAAPEFTRDNPNARLAPLEAGALGRAIEEHVAALRAGRLSRTALQRHQRRHFSPGDAARRHLALIS